jgi:putative two-component system response regulator
MLQDLNSSTILVVDDELRNIHLLKRFLNDAGFANLHTTADSRQALGMYKQLQPDLVLLDISMPFLDGFEVMKQFDEVRGHEEYVPVLVLTADITPETRRRALTCGAKDFLTKPLDLSDVLLRVRNLLETRQLYVQIREQNVHLERTVWERTHQLAESRREILARLALAGEYRDHDTGEHTRRVGNIAAAISEACGANPEYVDLIRHAAPLHDVGKIGIPDHILRKKGKLAPEEFDVMKLHTKIGAKILSGSQDPLLTMAESIVLTHHEWWDGSGYPSGLAGASIPFEGRIVALADNLDALLSERPYKRAWTLEAAIEAIKNLKGKQFDPALTDVLVGLTENNDFLALVRATDSRSASAETKIQGGVDAVGFCETK